MKVAMSTFKKTKNPDYVTDESGELLWKTGNFVREMCFQDAPLLPTPDECHMICKQCCAWNAPQLRKEVVMLGGYRDRESLLPTLSEEEKSNLCLLPSDVEGNTHQIAFQLCAPRQIAGGDYTIATRAPQRTYGNRKHLLPADERALWIHAKDKATHEVPQDFPPNLWLHKDPAVRNTVGEPYSWPRVNKTPGQTSLKGVDPILGSPCCDVWSHHMRRDRKDACTAIPRDVEEWPPLSDEQLYQESQMEPLSIAADLAQLSRIWHTGYRYAPPREGPSRWEASQSQSSGSTGVRSMVPKGQRDWNRQTNTNAAWGGASSGSELQTPARGNTRGASRWFPDL